MATDLRARARYAALALATMLAGLAVHLGTWLAPGARDALGDALWATMLSWWIGAAAPRASLGKRSLVSIAACWAVELSQLHHAPGLDALRRTPPGHLVLGSGFDPRDLAAYAVGVLAATACERRWRGRPTHGARAPG
jgi:hypothetical protein